MVKKQRMPKRDQSDKNSRNTGRILLILMMLVLVVLGVRFSYVAITKDVRGHRLDKAAQLIYRSQNEIPAKRGEIFDAVGNPLAESSTTYTLVAVLDKSQKSAKGKPMYVKKSQDKVVSEKIASVLGGKAQAYVQSLKSGRKDKLQQVQFGQLGSNLNVKKYKQLKALNIPGLSFVSSESRLYPNGTFASDLIGLTKNENSSDGKVISGITGIEQSWNKQLTGHNGVKTTSSDTTDRSVSKKNLAVKNGYDVYTTINTKLQSTLEKSMQTLADDMKPKAAVAVVMDTKTGKIVATTQRPSYNATTGEGIGDLWTNQLYGTAFEPGSVLKGITLASAIDSGNWNENDTYESGTLKIGDKKVTDWNNGEGWGRITYGRGIAESSNVAMALTEQKMGAQTWRKYLNRFKFLKPTKTGFSDEARGSMQFQYPIEQANTAFGQAISVTPLQMMQAYSAIANNGKELQPQIIEKIVDPNTNRVVSQPKTKVVAKPISKASAKDTRKQLEDVIYSQYGLGKMYAIPNVRTTGKSGTAQIATSTGYSTPGDNTNEIHSWMGMAPSNNPRYMMYIVTKQPQQNTDNISTDMANVFKTVMTQALDMSESDNKVVVSANQEVSVPTVVGGSTKESTKEMKSNRLTPIVMGDGQTVKGQSITGGKKSIVGQQIFLNTGKNIAVPDMRGWAKSDVLAWAELAKIKVNISGTGFVSTQSVKANSKLSDGYHEITVEFKEPKTSN
ncbi:penicillin-binding protein [Weissella paramesenteroides]|uniref:Penicillin-binding protein, transpeptidase domain protein n=1 Tax=Weissella paramesenteroides ATCC 33313 TaxID=585506 RepID=C5RAG9_WEIPA|nr:penicillin-binding protein [Weissella paramesenteroides]ATF40853.1 penicillin-binding protein [Weissella paramesenteroides]EER74812.1 penicillin-binding protein, transpeptidase domain protein [Weissella paramesenteroides ATCC 33313]